MYENQSREKPNWQECLEEVERSVHTNSNQCQINGVVPKK